MDPRSTRRGRFISLEGPDGAGKSVQAARLAARYRAAGYAVTLTREPGGTPLGERIRDVLLASDDTARTPASDALLFSAARSQLVWQVIRPALERGDAVVCDRFADSTVAYQGYGSGMDREALRQLEHLATKGLLPDHVLLLDLPVQVGLERRERGVAAQLTRFEHSPHHDVSYHERVREGYLEMAAADPDRWHVIDATSAPDVVAEAIATVLRADLEQSEPIAPLLRIRT